MTLLVVPGGGDVEAIARRLADAGVPAYEARQSILRGVPFAMATDVESARGVAVELRALGVEAWAVDEDAWRAAPRLQVARSFRLFAEGIEVTTRPTAAEPAQAHPIRWIDVELILPARSMQSSVTERVKTTRRPAVNPMRLMRGMRSKTEIDHVHDESEERFVLLLSRAPNTLLRFDMAGLDYTGLEARQPIARANYEALLGRLKAGAVKARIDDRLEKLASRLAGAPAGTSQSAMSAGMVKRVDKTFNEDNEGAVITAARLLVVAERLRRAVA